MIDFTGISCTEVSCAWKLPSIRSITRPTTGTIHQVFLLSTDETRYVLRAYRYTQKDFWRIVSEHDLSSYVHAHGLPAIAPLPLPSGETILEREGHFYGLFPFAKGQQIPREQMTNCGPVAAMGHFLGSLHHILHDYPRKKVRCQSFIVDPQATLAKIEKVETAIAQKGSFDPFDQQTLAQLAQRRDWLIAAHSVDLNSFLSLERQVLHGDYQETNLFFVDDNISAVIDWDQAYVAPRSWEVVRTLHYVLNLDATRCQTFLNAYRQIFPLSSEELAITANAYGWVQANNLWAYTSFYLEHNHRVCPLLQSGPFLPFEEIWARMHLQ